MLNSIILILAHTVVGESFLHHYQFYLWILLFILLVIGSYFMYQKARKTMALLKSNYEKSENRRMEMEEQLLNLNKTVQLNQELHDVLLMKIGQQEEIIAEFRKGESKIQISKSDCYEALCLLLQEKKANPDQNVIITEEFWNQIRTEINQVSFDFTDRLSDKYERLTKDDIHFCCLVKFGFKYSDIALLFNCERAASYKKKDAILHRMDLDKHSKLENVLDEIYTRENFVD